MNQIYCTRSMAHGVRDLIWMYFPAAAASSRGSSCGFLDGKGMKLVEVVLFTSAHLTSHLFDGLLCPSQSHPSSSQHLLLPSPFFFSTLTLTLKQR
jgi:hypothetical protein